MYLGHLDLKEKEVLLDHQVQQGQKARLDHGVFQVLRVQEGLEADLVFLEGKVNQGMWDFLVGMDK